MVTVTLWTDAGALDIALRPDGTAGYDDLHDSLTIVNHEGHEVPVASLADVIRSKEAAGREKDLLVLPALRAHLRRNAGEQHIAPSAGASRRGPSRRLVKSSGPTPSVSEHSPWSPELLPASNRYTDVEIALSADPLRG